MLRVLARTTTAAAVVLALELSTDPHPMTAIPTSDSHPPGRVTNEHERSKPRVIDATRRNHRHNDGPDPPGPVRDSGVCDRLRGLMLLAAACGDRAITDVYRLPAAA